MDDLLTWLTIPEMAKATGKSTRSIERLITLHRVQVAKRPKQGMKPETVIAPDEVETHRAVLLRPTVETDTLPVRQPARLPASAPLRQPDIGALLKALDRLRVPLSQMVYLTEKEAAAFLGFPHSEVKKLLNAGTMPSIRLSNGWRRIARKDLEQYRPPESGTRRPRKRKNER